MNIRTYSELVKMDTFEERFEYLCLNGKVGKETFGFDRVFNQMFYASAEWLRVRDKVISRDLGCDLGCPDRPINDVIIAGKLYRPKIFIHHMNPFNMDDLKHRPEILLNPEYLITTTKATHDAIHYGNSNNLMNNPIAREPNDTCPWKR